MFTFKDRISTGKDMDGEGTVMEDKGKSSHSELKVFKGQMEVKFHSRSELCRTRARRRTRNKAAVQK